MKQTRRTTNETATAAAKAPLRAAAKARAQSRHGADPAPARKVPVAPEAAERERMIAMAAYFRAEKRGFTSGSEVEDWLEAEKEVASRLAG